MRIKARMRMRMVCREVLSSGKSRILNDWTPFMLLVVMATTSAAAEEAGKKMIYVFLINFK